MTEPNTPQGGFNIDPNKVIDGLTTELTQKIRQTAELYAAFEMMREENDRLKAELGKANSDA